MAVWCRGSLEYSLPGISACYISSRLKDFLKTTHWKRAIRDHLTQNFMEGTISCLLCSKQCFEFCKKKYPHFKDREITGSEITHNLPGATYSSAEAWI